MFYFVYILLSKKDRKFYIGFSANVEQRVIDHNHGRNISTRNRRPLYLIFYEAYLNKSDALRREQYFKTAKGKTTLKQILRNYLHESSSALSRQCFKSPKISK